MNLKNLLKALKLNESTISMMLGALVIVVVGLLVVNYFRSTEPGSTFPQGLSDEQIAGTLPTTHTVVEGETLWDIAEIYYDSGYNWTDIAEANDLSSADIIEKGQVLTIPALKEESTELAEATLEPTIAPTPAPSPEPTKAPVVEKEEEVVPAFSESTKGGVPTKDVYIVKHGDNLWNIAVEVYGDGYRWTDIAKANNLANPSIIHAGNEFVIPR